MYKSRPQILVVDDDDRLRALLQKFLDEQGFMVTTVDSAAKARKAMEESAFDVIVLDVMMPQETGLEFLGTLDAATRPPVLMLSAMGETDDRIRGLETGADDYLSKPFEPKELVLRINAIVRRKQGKKNETGVIIFGDNQFNLANGQLSAAGKMIALTSGEIAMLKLLAQHAGKPVTREALVATLPGTVSERSIDVQITRLRKKIEENEGKPVHLQSVRGVGYVLYASRQEGAA